MFVNFIINNESQRTRCGNIYNKLKNNSIIKSLLTPEDMRQTVHQGSFEGKKNNNKRNYIFFEIRGDDV